VKIFVFLRIRSIPDSVAAVFLQSRFSAFINETSPKTSARLYIPSQTSQGPRVELKPESCSTCPDMFHLEVEIDSYLQEGGSCQKFSITPLSKESTSLTGKFELIVLLSFF
jgi:hypothetical protein